MCKLKFTINLRIIVNFKYKQHFFVLIIFLQTEIFISKIYTFVYLIIFNNVLFIALGFFNVERA
jgi:hypothetical protein